MLIWYIQVKMQVNSWLTLQWLLWGAFQVKALRRLVSWSWVVGSIDLTFDWYQSYWKCLQWSKSRRISTCLRFEHASNRTSWWGSTVEEAKLQFSCGYALDNIKYIPVQSSATLPYGWCENWRMVSYELNQKFHHSVVSIFHATALLKVVLSFDYVNTSGHKPCTLCTHFTHPYWVLDTLPNHYY